MTRMTNREFIIEMDKCFSSVEYMKKHLDLFYFNEESLKEAEALSAYIPRCLSISSLEMNFPVIHDPILSRTVNLLYHKKSIRESISSLPSFKFVMGYEMNVKVAKLISSRVNFDQNIKIDLRDLGLSDTKMEIPVNQLLHRLSKKSVSTLYKSFLQSVKGKYIFTSLVPEVIERRGCKEPYMIDNTVIVPLGSEVDVDDVKIFGLMDAVFNFLEGGDKTDNLLRTVASSIANFKFKERELTRICALSLLTNLSIYSLLSRVEYYPYDIQSISKSMDNIILPKGKTGKYVIFGNDNNELKEYTLNDLKEILQ